MKSQLTDGLASRPYSNEVPAWVSEMGLEWLHELLSSFSRSKTARLI